MNERILELARQVWPDPSISHTNHLKFAELIVRECISTIENAENGYQDYRSQIEDAMRDHCVWLIKQKFGVE